MQCNVSTRIWTRSISCYYYFSLDHIMQNYSLNLKLCQYQVSLVYEFLLVNSSAFLMTTFHYGACIL